MIKHFTIFALTIFSLTANSQTFNLTVNNGYGSGLHSAGDTIDVFANPNPTNTVFNNWTSSFSSINTFPSLNEYHIRIVMPSQNVTLSATYQNYAPWSFTHTTINGKELYYYFPVGMKGIVQCYHGSGGSATAWTDSIKGVENLNFCRYAVAHNYGVFITESNNRSNKQWNVSVVDSTNPDIVSIYSMLDTLKNQNILTGNEKMFGVGHSQGSGFNSVISFVKNFCASALSGVAGKDTVFYFTNTPTYWQASLNDTSADILRIPKIIANYNVLSGRGIDAEYHILNPSPLFPKRFERIAGIDSSMAVGIFNDLSIAGYLNAQNFFNTNHRVNSNYINSVTAVPASFDGGIDDQVTVAFTEHKFYSGFNRLIIDFFDNHLCDSTTTGLNNLLEKNQISLYPNPATTELNIYLPSANNFTTEIISMLGETVVKALNQRTIDIALLQNGVYFIRIVQDKKMFHSKFIKQ
jgi:hypothetical protein